MLSLGRHTYCRNGKQHSNNLVGEYSYTPYALGGKAAHHVSAVVWCVHMTGLGKSRDLDARAFRYITPMSQNYNVERVRILIRTVTVDDNWFRVAAFCIVAIRCVRRIGGEAILKTQMSPPKMSPTRALSHKMTSVKITPSQNVAMRNIAS